MLIMPVHSIDVETSAHCPDCGTELCKTRFRERSVLDIEPVKIKTVLYRLQERICPHCKKKVRAKAPGVLAHSFYSNKLISYLVTEHYLHRIPINHLAQRLGLSLGSVIGYNKSPCHIQYCYAHLLRAVQDIITEFPNKSGSYLFCQHGRPSISSGNVSAFC